MLAVGLPKPVVPQTVTPRSAAAFMSMELLRAPVVISNFMSGRPSITLRLNGVRSRIMLTMVKPCSALMTASSSPSAAVEDLDLDVFGDARPVGEFQGDVLIVVEDRCLNHTPTLLIRVPGTLRAAPI